MRLVVACQSCARQYDGSGRAIGSRFRCHCGAVVTVSQPAGHDAAVIRCSSCGGPRAGGENDCAHCGASFTLHERDLHTICPGCLARVSDRARFCHHCGTGIAPQQAAGRATEMPCPVCDGSTLSHRQLAEDVAILECGSCAGMWLANATFESLAKRAQTGALPKAAGLAAAEDAVREERQASMRQQGPLYRKCPQCATMMNRRNYGRASGIIVDVCRDCGTWFDAQELSAILRWIGSGGLAKTRQLEEDEARRQQQVQRDRRDRQMADVRRGGGTAVDVGGDGGFGDGPLARRVGGGIDLLDGLASLASLIFKL